jgi:hypothetical protein
LLGAPRIRLIAVWILTPDQCRPEGPSPFPKLDPLLAGRRDHLGIRGGLPLPDQGCWERGAGSADFQKSPGAGAFFI